MRLRAKLELQAILLAEVRSVVRQSQAACLWLIRAQSLCTIARFHNSLMTVSRTQLYGIPINAHL